MKDRGKYYVRFMCDLAIEKIVQALACLTCLLKERLVKDGLQASTGAGDEGGLGNRARSEVSPELKIPGSVVALEKSKKGGHIHVEVDEQKAHDVGEKWRCKDTDCSRGAHTVDNFWVLC